MICGNNGVLSYEHIPPKGALNSKSKLVQNHEHLLEESNPKFGKSGVLRKGFGKYCLCEKCNNFLGANYVNDYIDFVNQCIHQYDEAILINEFKVLEFNIKPLNIFKQITAMFLCLNEHAFTKDDKEIIKRFLLEKENRTFIENHNIYIYNTFSSLDKWIGCQTLYRNGTVVSCSEIAYKPFGFQFTFNSNPTDLSFQTINDFINFDIDKIVSVKMALPRHDTKRVFLGH